jgi:HD superfamily phosphodiesterase
MLISKVFTFVMSMSAKHSIDESHGLSHSMNVLYYANKLFESEVIKKPYLREQERLIYVSAALHDMCDKKYMNEMEGIKEIEFFLKDKITPREVEMTKNIMSTMSYSKVNKNGFPDWKEYQSAYHIVRESDLLTAYDFDRSMIYHMSVSGVEIEGAYENAKDIFMKRILKHNEDKLFFTDYAKEESILLEKKAIKRMNYWKRIIENPNMV